MLNAPLVELTSMLWVLILLEYKSLSYKTMGSPDAAVCCDSRFESILFKSRTLQLAKSPNTITEPHAGFMNRVILGCRIFTNFSPHIDTPI